MIARKGSRFIYQGNRLRQVRSNGAVVETYRYDTAGRRVLAWSPATGNILSHYGTIVERSEYEPFGKLMNRGNDDRPGYTGHVMCQQRGERTLQFRQQRGQTTLPFGTSRAFRFKRFKRFKECSLTPFGPNYYYDPSSQRLTNIQDTAGASVVGIGIKGMEVIKPVP